MANKYNVLNAELELYGQRFLKRLAPIPQGLQDTAERARMRALFLEQLLLFDKVTVKATREDLALYFLVREFGINAIESLLDKGLLRVLLWTPNLITLSSRNGSERLDPGTPPIMGSGYSADDADVEKHINGLLKNFTGLHRDRKKIFTRIAAKGFVVPDWHIADNIAQVTIQAYENNRLSKLGLPFVKDPDQLTLEERRRLLDLGSDVLETELLAKYSMRSYERYEHFELTQAAITEIEAALNVSENTSEILTLEKVAAIQPLVTERNLSLDAILKLRYHPDVKQYRKWINEISVGTDANEISRAYISAIQGSGGGFSGGTEKLLRVLSMFTIGTTLSTLVAGSAGIAAGLALSLFDSYVLEGLTKGYDPRLFVDRMRAQANTVVDENA